MRIVTRGITILSVSSSGSTSSSRVPIDIAAECSISNNERGWSRLDFSNDCLAGRLIISWTLPNNEKRSYSLELRITPARRARRRGWERLRVQQNEEEFRAYRVLVGPTKGCMGTS